MKKFYATSLLLLSLAAASAQYNCNNYFPVIAPDGATIYFSSDRHGGNWEIYKADIDGISNLTRLTNTTSSIQYLALSPDGSKIVFQQDGYGPAAEIFVMNNDGTGLTQLTNNSVFDGCPNFSPDGSKIVYCGWDGDQYPEIFVMDTDGNNKVQLTNVAGAYWQYNPKYNPAGDKIYLELGYNADNHIACMNTDGTNWVDITPANDFGYMDGALSFNSDGSKILFLTTDYLGYANGSDIILANADGSNWVNLTNAPAGEYNFFAVFNPANDKIYYSSAPSGAAYNIKSMSTDGSSVAHVTNCSQVGFDEYPVAKGLAIYPNPVEDILNVQASDAYSVSIFDFTGRFMLQSKSGMVDVSALETGIYTIVFQDAGNNIIKTGKLIKK
ncbi:MAG TPA: DUF5050 domain-containing protein [Bacteroidales bacterium]|nr:DUF5050 domain-containing protein [Bacteroidales bacterium]